MRHLVYALMLLSGCTTSSSPNGSDGESLPIEFSIVKESGADTSLEFSINRVVVVDTTLAPDRSMTGLVLSRTLRLKPGTHVLELFDRDRGMIQRIEFTTRPEPMYANIRIRRGMSALTAGSGILEFM